MAIARALLEDLSDRWWVRLLGSIVGVIFRALPFSFDPARVSVTLIVFNPPTHRVSQLSGE